jgi:hypothetical protein
MFYYSTKKGLTKFHSFWWAEMKPSLSAKEHFAARVKKVVLELSVILDRNDFMAVKDINRDVRKMNNLSQVDHDRGVGWGYVTEKNTAQQASGVQIKFSRKYPELGNDTASLSRTWPRKDIDAVNLELARVQSRARKGNK